MAVGDMMNGLKRKMERFLYGDEEQPRAAQQPQPFAPAPDAAFTQQPQPQYAPPMQANYYQPQQAAPQQPAYQQPRAQGEFTQRMAAPQENTGSFYARQQQQPVSMPAFSSPMSNAGYVPDDMEAAE